MHVFRFKKLCKPGFCILQTKYRIIFTIAFANVSSSDTWILAITQSSIRHENRLGNSDAGKISVFSTSGSTAICKQKENYNIRHENRLGNSDAGKISVFSTSGNTAICKQKENYNIRHENRLGNSDAGKISVFSTSGNTAICKQKGNYSIRQLDNSMPNKIYKYLLNQIYQYSLKCESQIGENIINKLFTMHTHHFNCSSLIKYI
jgi:hypothetical protein